MWRLYEDEGLSLAEVGKRFGVSRQRVHQEFVKAGIKTRGRVLKSLDRKVLHRLYVVTRLSISETAKKLGVSSGVVERELERHGIERRTNNRLEFDRELIERLYVKQGLSQIETGKRLGVHARIVMRELRRYGITLRHAGRYAPVRIERDLLDRLYVQDKLSTETIGKRLGYSPKTIARELRRHGLPVRPSGRQRRTDQ